MDHGCKTQAQASLCFAKCRDHYTPKNNVSIPTGEIASVKGTPFDFTFSKSIGQDIAEVPGGYDHNFVLHGMGRQAKFTTRKGIASEM